jgi:K+:H+ antiporter
MRDTLFVALVLLLASVFTVAWFRRFDLPPVLGYLLVGMLAGPNALGIVPNADETRVLAQYGVVFLMFSIGLEFSLPQLMSMRRTVFGFGGAQVLVTLILIMTVAVACGFSWREGFALGALAAMSSTAIVSKMLADRLELHSGHGRQIMGILLFQDLAVVPLLILLPALGAAQADIGVQILAASIKAAAALALLLWFGKDIVRKWFRLVARQRSSEIFVLNVLLITLGLGFLTNLAGLSVPLGAFLAGMLLSETEYRYQVEDYIKPFHDLLLGLFFVTIGMLLDLRAAITNIGWICVALGAFLSLKFAVIWALGRLFGNSAAVSLRAALALAPAGEFGLVLLAVAGGVGLLSSAMTQIALAAMLVSMLLTPLLLSRSDSIVLYLCESEWMERAMAVHALAVKSMGTEGHVIVCGYGRSGQNVARFLEREGIATIALDLDPERVRAAAAAGHSVVYGDAGRREVLVAAGLHRAAAVVVSFSDARMAIRIIHHAHAMEPALPVIVRTFDDTELDKLRAAGAAEIVPEVLEGSLMLATHAMLLLGVPLARVLKRIRQVRQERYQLMRGFFHGTSDEPDDVHEASQPRLQSVVLTEGAFAKGKTLAELDLGSLQVEVTAIRRRNLQGATPTPDIRLEPSDVVVLLGTPERLALAEARLLQG